MTAEERAEDAISIARFSIQTSEILLGAVEHTFARFNEIIERIPDIDPIDVNEISLEALRSLNYARTRLAEIEEEE